MTPTEALQHAIGTPVDGIWGPKSRAALWAGINSNSASVMAALASYVASQLPTPEFTSLGIAMADCLHRHGITDNAARLANFLGQGAHETMGFRRFREIWGPTKTQLRYEGRKDLGNDQPGDGKRFMGRGIFQTTGRSNYVIAGTKLGVDLVANPTLLETPEYAVMSACVFWGDRNLSALADAGKDDEISRRINGKYCSTLEERRVYVARAKRVLT